MNIPKINKRNVDKMNREQILQTQCNAILLLYAKYAKKKFIMNSYKFEDLSDQYYNDNIANFSYSDETIDHNCKNSPIWIANMTAISANVQQNKKAEHN